MKEHNSEIKQVAEVSISVDMLHSLGAFLMKQACAATEGEVIRLRFREGKEVAIKLEPRKIVYQTEE